MYLRRRLADVEHARDVGAVAAHRSAEVAEHDFAIVDDPIRRGSWCGLAACAPAATIAKFARSCPRGEDPLDELAVHVELRAARERPEPHLARDRIDSIGGAARSAAISASSLTTRSGPVTPDARTNSVPGIAVWRSSTNRAHVWSPIAARPGVGPQGSATSATGSSVSFQATTSNTSGCGSTRGASRRGTTSCASPRRGSTNIVRRSSGIASYPVRYGRSAPTDSNNVSTSSSSIRSRARDPVR